jgi:sporulation protein YlmC with PRC-barrel domain
MHLIRDVLDKKLFDRNNDRMGRVDGLIMQLPERSQPRITHITIGGRPLAQRIGSRTAALTRKIAEAIGPKRLTPVRIPWSLVKTAGRDIHLEVDAEESGAMAWEGWIEKHIIDHIPGAG